MVLFSIHISDKRKRGFCKDIVLDLCETVSCYANYNVYFDNYLTTIRLQIELKKLGIFTAGAVRPNKLVDSNIKSAKDLSKEGRGVMDHSITEVEGMELFATRWYDNNIVTCLSTLHSCELIDSTERWSSKQKRIF